MTPTEPMTNEEHAQWVETHGTPLCAAWTKAGQALPQARRAGVDVA
jgi:hypothetical protein